MYQVVSSSSYPQQQQLQQQQQQQQQTLPQPQHLMQLPQPQYIPATPPQQLTHPQQQQYSLQPQPQQQVTIHHHQGAAPPMQPQPTTTTTYYTVTTTAPPQLVPLHQQQQQQLRIGGGSRRNGRILEAYDAEFHHVVSLPLEKVHRTPDPSLGVTRLVLCRNYDVSDPVNSCSKGHQCKFVHADTTAAKYHPIHVNYAYRSLEKCSYARLPAGETITVMAPNERPPTDEVPSERVLVTRGSLMRKEHNGPLSHCAHYYFNRVCNRGERCNFIHSVTVDPTVTSDFKRAPARSTHRTAQPAPLQSAPTTTAAVAPATKQPRIQQPHLVTPLPSAAVSSLSSVIDVTAAAVPLPLSSCQLRSTCSEDACCFSGDDEAGSCGCEDEECLALTNDFSPQGRWQGGCCAGGMCGCCSVANKTKSSHLTTMESLPNHRNMEVPKKPTTQQQPQQQQEHLERSDEEEEDDSIPPTLVAAPIPDRHRYRFNPYNRQRSVVLLGVA